MLEIKASELAPENIGKPIKLLSFRNKDSYQMLMGFEVLNDAVIIYTANDTFAFTLDVVITVYDNDF